MLALRLATLADLEHLLPRTRALNDHEGIAVSTDSLRAALEILLTKPELGGAWLVTRDDAPIGYALVTYGFDLEYGGRDAWITELWIDEAARGGGNGAQVLAMLEPELRACGVGAVHLQVRPENPAKRLYERMGFAASPRVVMTRTIS